MTPLDKLLAEELPTGNFGHALPPRTTPSRPAPKWTPEEQAAHWAELGRAIAGWVDPDERERRKASHLRVVDGEDSEAAA
ncbi:hypothetical protein [Streptomyces chartreusis]